MLDKEMLMNGYPSLLILGGDKMIDSCLHHTYHRVRQPRNDGKADTENLDRMDSSYMDAEVDITIFSFFILLSKHKTSGETIPTSPYYMANYQGWFFIRSLLPKFVPCMYNTSLVFDDIPVSSLILENFSG